jgi:hypothetical protein
VHGTPAPWIRRTTAAPRGVMTGTVPFSVDDRAIPVPTRSSAALPLRERVHAERVVTRTPSMTAGSVRRRTARGKSSHGILKNGALPRRSTTGARATTVGTAPPGTSSDTIRGGTRPVAVETGSTEARIDTIGVASGKSVGDFFTQSVRIDAIGIPPVSASARAVRAATPTRSGRARDDRASAPTRRAPVEPVRLPVATASMPVASGSVTALNLSVVTRRARVGASTRTAAVWAVGVPVATLPGTAPTTRAASATRGRGAGQVGGTTSRPAHCNAGPLLLQNSREPVRRAGLPFR